MLNTIFMPKLGWGRLLFSGVAFLAGLCLVLLALQGYIGIRHYLLPKKGASSYIMLNKEVGFAHTLLGGKARFSEEEILDLKQQKFAEDVGVFHASQFEVRAYLGGNLGFYTEMFFESVPSRFIDNVPRNFQWSEGADVLPIIISQDFLNLYNFGFAVARGTPQLSRSTIELVPLKVEVYGPLGRRVMNARVVGFSERIASILVPEEFLQWANSTIAGVHDKSAARAIVKVRNDRTASLDEYLEKKNLKVSDEKMRLSQVLNTLNVVMSVLVVIGTAFMVFSLLIVILNFSLMVAHAKEEVSLLLQLGYRGRQLSRHLSGYLLIFMAMVSIGTAVVFIIGNSVLANFLVSHGLGVERGVSWEVILSGVVCVLVAVAVSYYSIRRMIGSRG